MIFGIGSSRQATDLVRGDRPRFVEFGNYAYTTGSGKNRTTHHWGYVAVKLDVPLPHIVLDATSNNALFGSNLPATFDKRSAARPRGRLRPALLALLPRRLRARRAVPVHARHHGAVHRPCRGPRRRDRRRLAVPLRQARLLDARPGDLGLAVLRRRRAARQVRAVGAVARRAAGDGCRGRGIRPSSSPAHVGTAAPFAAPCRALRPPPAWRRPAAASGAPGGSAGCSSSCFVAIPGCFQLVVGRGSSASGFFRLTALQRTAAWRDPAQSSRVASHAARRAACSSGSGTGSDAMRRLV